MTKSKIGPVKFLLVDDREENLIALEALLRRPGLEILTARTGDQALELLLAHDVALAILDVQMPEMDGFALAELMRGSERSRHVPIIFVTAASHEQHRIFQGYDAGAVDFLFKPIDPRILRHKTAVFFDLYQQRQHLAEALRVNETFAAAIGHDLRNPVHSIAMATDLILLQELEPNTRRYAERIRKSARRISGLIDDLFDLARVRLGGGISLQRVRTDLAVLTRTVVAECQAGAATRPFEVRQEGDTMGEWDPARVAQILSNLLGNAIRHGVRDTPIEVLVQGRPSSVLVAIHNQGFIPPSVRAVLFDPFRGGETRGSPEGLGLGLFIVQQLVAAHRGSVEVESTEHAGTTFRVELPRS